MSLTQFNQHLAILYRALESEMGLVVRTPAPQRTKMDFIHAQFKDENLKVLRIEISRTNPDGEVWVIKEFPA